MIISESQAFALFPPDAVEFVVYFRRGKRDLEGNFQEIARRRGIVNLEGLETLLGGYRAVPLKKYRGIGFVLSLGSCQIKVDGAKARQIWRSRPKRAAKR